MESADMSLANQHVNWQLKTGHYKLTQKFLLLGMPESKYFVKRGGFRNLNEFFKKLDGFKTDFTLSCFLTYHDSQKELLSRQQIVGEQPLEICVLWMVINAIMTLIPI